MQAQLFDIGCELAPDEQIPCGNEAIVGSAGAQAAVQGEVQHYALIALAESVMHLRADYNGPRVGKAVDQFGAEQRLVLDRIPLDESDAVVNAAPLEHAPIVRDRRDQLSI